MSDAQAARLKPAIAPTGSTVFAKIGEALKAERFRQCPRPTAIDNNMMVAVAVPEVCDPDFLFYMLQGLHLAQHANGSALPYFTQARLEQLDVHVPDLEKQEAIAEVLGALDDKIAANAALVRTTTELAQALTRRALTSGALGTLGEIASITMGSSPKGTSYNEGGGGVTMYQGTRDFGVRFPSPRVWTTEPLRLADAGDVLISVRAPVGSLNVADVECCIGRGLAAAKSGTPSSVYHLLSAQPEVFASFNSDGTIFGSISKQQLHELSLKLPADLAALEFELQPLEALVAATLRESQTLAELRDTLLPALMDGTIRVKDAISQAEEVL